MKLKFLILCLACIPGAWATTTVAQTVLGEDGNPSAGTVYIRINTPCVSGGSYVSNATKMVRFQATTNNFSVALVPNDTCVPSGTSYTVAWALTGGRSYSEVWVVPTSASPVTIGDVRVSITPTPTTTLNLPQLDDGGATTGQCLTWNGTVWAPGDCAEGAGGGLTDPGSNGLVARTSSSTTAARTITAGSSQLSVANGNGVSGNPTIDIGTLTANTSGNAGTATALAANGANCSAGQFPLGVNASGAAESCTALPTSIAGTANQITASASTGAVTLSIPNSPTLPGTTTGTFSGNLTGNASTSTALAANGTNCSSGEYARGVDASGNAENCTTAATGTVTVVSSGNLTNTAIVTGGGSQTLQTPSSAATVDSSGNLTATSATFGDGTVAGEMKALELTANGSNYRSWLVPNSLSADLRMRFPDAVPSAGDVATFGAPSSNISDITFKGVASSNTASAIVTRDSSGNFSAGTITATVSGNASTATALAADPSDCSAGSPTIGINASGTAQGCITLATVATSGSASDLGSGTLAVARGGTGIGSGTSGGVLAFTASGTIASSGALTADLPVIGGGAGVAPTVGTRSGNTTKFATTTGTLTSGNCVTLDANGNFIDAGGPCTTGGGGGTVNAGTATHLAYYATSTNAVSDMGSDFTFASNTLTAGSSAKLDMGAAPATTGLKVPTSAGGAPTADGQVAYDSTADALKFGNSGNTKTVADLDSSQTFTNKTLTAPVISTISNTGTVTLPTATDTLVGKATTDTLTNKTLDAEGTGNVLTIPMIVAYKAAVCQNTTASLGFSTPTSNPAVATCITGSNTQYATADFADGSDLSVQDHFPLPPDFTGNIDLSLKWRTSATSGDVVWQVQTICVADAETGDPSFNTASTVTDAAKGTTLQFNDASITSITITGCAAGEEFYFKLRRDSGHASDSLAATAQLISARFTIRRAI